MQALTGCSPEQAWKMAIPLAVYAAAEYWLGKTNRIKPASVIEVGIAVLSVAGYLLWTALQRIFKRKEIKI